MRDEPMHAGVSTVGYFTDVEGHSDYFDKCVASSGVLTLVSDSSGDEQLDVSGGDLCVLGCNCGSHAVVVLIQLRPGAAFVFGGDAFDKGTGDLRIARLLGSLKKRYPDRVFLLMGNRDLNKIKLTSELHESDTHDRPVDAIPGAYVVRCRYTCPAAAAAAAPHPPACITMYVPIMTRCRYWVPKDSPQHVTLLQYLSDQADTCDTAVLNALHTPETRLQFMYQHQMGCQHTMDFRRADIAARRGCAPHEVSDKDVVEEVRRAVAPTGVVGEYIRLCQLGVVIGDTLFVHGGVTEESMGFVPAPVNHDKLQSDPPGTNLAKAGHSVQDWIVALNEYCAQGIADWVANPLWNSDRTQRGGSMVMGCVATARTRCISACGTHMGAMWQVWVSSRHEWSYCDGAKLYGASTAP